MQRGMILSVGKCPTCPGYCSSNAVEGPPWKGDDTSRRWSCQSPLQYKWPWAFRSGYQFSSDPSHTSNGWQRLGVLPIASFIPLTNSFLIKRWLQIGHVLVLIASGAWCMREVLATSLPLTISYPLNVMFINWFLKGLKWALYLLQGNL